MSGRRGAAHCRATNEILRAAADIPERIWFSLIRGRGWARRYFGMGALAKIPPGVGPKYPQVLVLVGATGDLSQRKLLPGLFHLCNAGFIPSCRIIGVSLDAIDVDGFRTIARGALDKFSARKPSEEDWSAFSSMLDYVPMAAGAEALKAAVERAERSRIIMEKPFGTDLASAQSLNAKLHEVFSEDQIFRIDHFLGKEPAQNILAFRFANCRCELIWNRNFIDHVQIDVPETLGLGKRSAFYEATGAYRDMVVTHLFQILAFMAMEPPTALLPAPISEEKNKVFRSMLPIDPHNVVRGQYAGYRAEEGVDPESDTETFIALKCTIDNWRWAGVPFFLRTGKRMAEGQRIISIAFREAPKSMFPVGSGVGAQGPDHLTFDLADASKVSLSFYGKRPGPGMRLDKLSMQFALNETGLIGDVLEAYERLILDAMRGDHTLFTTAEGIERLWEVSIPLLEAPPPVRLYAPDSWGPKSVHQLVAPHAWRLPFERAWRKPNASGS
jgi:glucose-6-phosphate 1-dehydrogenase